MTDTKTAVQIALGKFANLPLLDAARLLFETLGYSSTRSFSLIPNTADEFQRNFDPDRQLNSEKALPHQWDSVDLVFQIADDEINAALHGQRTLFTAAQVDQTRINSYLFIAIQLHPTPKPYTRAALAAIAREINKRFAMPVLVLFKHGDELSLAILHRRIHQRDSNRDVLEKVTLIKAIKFAHPHRAHLEILHDLSLTQLAHKYPLTNFVDLQNAWEKTLDTAELNKRFYREIANWYFWAARTVRFPDSPQAPALSPQADAAAHAAVIRLITRLIFVWFIKEKGLIPDALFDPLYLKTILNAADPQRSTYYKAILQNLFFATLNTEMTEARRFRGKNPAGRDGHYGIANVYRYEQWFTNPQTALDLFANVPFLNGGLFECLDRRDEKILVDGFSDDPRNQPVVPDELFFGEEHAEDLSEV